MKVLTNKIDPDHLCGFVILDPHKI